MSETELNENNDVKFVRAMISKEADSIVNEITNAVNTGFEAGKATKLDVTSFIIKWFKDQYNDEVLQMIRVQVANDLTMLDSLVKKAKSSGSLPPELKEVLAQHFFGSGLNSAKKAKKILKSEGIIDRHRNEEAA